jgi:hypothetical protein
LKSLLFCLAPSNDFKCSTACITQKNLSQNSGLRELLYEEQHVKEAS